SGGSPRSTGSSQGRDRNVRTETGTSAQDGVRRILPVRTETPESTERSTPGAPQHRWREPAVAGLAGAAALTVLLAVAHTLFPSIPFAPSTIAQSLVRTTPGSVDSFFIDLLGHWAQRLAVGPVTPPPARNPGKDDADFKNVPGLTPEVTSIAAHYVVDEELIDPDIDPATWRLSFGGTVDRPFRMSYAQLKSFPAVQ